jgi:hypothetical protein
MDLSTYFYWTFGFLLFTLVYLLIPRAWFTMPQRLSVSQDQATDALDRVNSWTTWLVGIQVAAIGFMGFLLKEGKCAIDADARLAGFFCLLCFGGSILLGSFLVQGLPSMTLRLKQGTTPKNFVFENHIFGFWSPRLGTIYSLLHTYFIAGLCFFSLFTILLLAVKK